MSRKCEPSGDVGLSDLDPDSENGVCLVSMIKDAFSPQATLQADSSRVVVRTHYHEKQNNQWATKCSLVLGKGAVGLLPGLFQVPGEDDAVWAAHSASSHPDTQQGDRLRGHLGEAAFQGRVTFFQQKHYLYLKIKAL